METKSQTLDLKALWHKMMSRKRLYIINCIIAFALSCLWILPQPRFYKSEVTLAPEMSGSSGGGSLSDIASSFGIDLGSGPSVDAFYPMLYPDLMKSTDFVVGLFDVPVKTLDGQVQTTYYDYLSNYQKSSFVEWPIKWVKRQIKNLLSSEDNSQAGKDGKVDPFMLSEQQQAMVTMVAESKVLCSIDKKTEVISILVTDQDKLVCATMADSVRERLQAFIIDYRTKKARVDVDYYEKLQRKAYADYEEAAAAYARYADTHQNAILQTTVAKRDALENDYQTKLGVYNTVTTQLNAAQAKLQERTPSFTIIQRATVPTKPAGPKRMLFVLGMLILTVLGTSLYIVKDDILGRTVKE